MKKTRKLIALLSAAALFFATAGSVMAETAGQGGNQNDPASVSAEAKEMVKDGDYVDDQVIVVFKDGVSDARIKKEIKTEDAKCLEITDSAADAKIAVADINKNDSVEEAITKLAQNPKVEYAQPNYRYKPAAVNDPYANDEGVNQWYLTNIKAREAWNLMETKKGSLSPVTVAVIDTGIDKAHEDLKSNVSGDSIKLDASGNITELRGDSESHGTHTAGIVGAISNNSKGIAGIASAGTGNRVKLMAIDATTKYDDGLYFNTYNLVEAIDYALSKNAKVINMSLGGAGKNYILEESIKAAYDQGVTVVAAAGNENTDEICFPSDYGEVISVCSLTRQNKRYTGEYGSNYGQAKDISAPGTNILSTVPGDYGQMSGTSMSAPMVSAVAAMLYSVKPDMEPFQVKNILCDTAEYLGEDMGAENTGDRKFDKLTGYGLVNAEKAVKAAMTGAAAEPESITFKAAGERIDEGQSQMLEVRVEPANVSGNPKWESSNEAVATVDDDGRVTAREAGKAEISCTIGSKKAVCTVLVAPVIEPTSLKIFNSDKAKNMAMGSAFSLDARVFPENAHNAEISWKSSDKNVVTVDEDGLVEARGIGKARIIGYTYNSKDKDPSKDLSPGNKVAQIVEVSVTYAEIAGVKLTASQKKIKLGTSYTFKAAFSPDNANQSLPVTWSSSNRSVADIDKKAGAVSTVGTGQTTIKATAPNGKLASLRITVFKTDYSGKAYGLKASPYSYAGNKLTWKSIPSADGYEIWRAAGKGKYAKVKTLDGTKKSWKNGKLKTGTKYKYKIRAYYKAGDKIEYCGYSSAKSATPKLKKASVKTKKENKKITVTWSKVRGATGYTVYKYSASKKKYVRKKTVKSSKAKKRVYTDKKVKWGKTYKYKVRAYRTIGGKRVYGPYSKAAVRTYR
ncbi:S8 family serine peptidase [Anaerovorax odorimutans]|uniref:S8 family serine peptidase n=1 Tax=Anaerovorax odorimutans TaxID=109327 RepID=A0ABT1RM11_9FIRM|nr:S8 family serine peptidase [Anaerovorax odorimutans]MCQ4636219.1 S8 family serine peptidase [Anaerovorax odorimutans]